MKTKTERKYKNYGEGFHPIFEKAIERFAEQFNCKLESTGYSTMYSENDGIGEQEFWVKGLITSHVKGLLVEIGGWFSHDTRDKKDNIYCLLAFRLNGKEVGNCEGIQAWYSLENESWSELVWETY